MLSLKKDPARENIDAHLKVLRSFAGSHSFPFSDLIIDHCCVYKVVSKSATFSVVAEDSRVLRYRIFDYESKPPLSRGLCVCACKGFMALGCDMYVLSNVDMFDMYFYRYDDYQ